MRTLTYILVGLLIGFGVVVWASRADCYPFCPNVICYSAGNCPSGCSCAFAPGSPSGRCSLIRGGQSDGWR